ncbi:hydroxycarboxylic acid receptor 2-like [Rhinatrema bivittatum]|uniref:hydroxycarboxylic acid receptor 2-like n=1 Tax=Rhinatrema bivittatum TaxID=194408 RepID=UPI00112A2926|nr:hydroxycarboxylic acid receptor 2-like [Rhinatrema bivittatum]
MNISNCCIFQEPLLFTILPPVLIMEFILGLAGNGFGLWMFCFHMKTWKPNSVYLLNLAVADFMVLFCLLFRTDYYLRKKNWIYGDVPCRVLLFMLAANRAAGIIFLTVVAVDRYLRIVHPFWRINRVSGRDAIIVSCLLWMVIFSMTTYLLAEPHLFQFQNSTQCDSFNICPASFASAVWHDAYYISQFLIPVCIIAYCTVRITWQLKGKTIDRNGKIKKAVRFVLTVAIVFTICYFPSNMVRISVWIMKLQYKEGCQQFKDASTAFYLTVCFTYFYSMLNPVVYYFSAPTFKGVLRNILPRLTKTPEQNSFSTSSSAWK